MKKTGNSWQVFAVVATGVFMSTLDSSMINVALPAIMNEFHSSLVLTQWVVMIYLLTITSSLLFWGHVADRVGRGRIYPAGMLLFGTASLVCSLAPHIGWLVCSRFFQAIGAAMMMATGPALVKDSTPVDRLGRSLGLIGIAVSGGLMAGPFLGGLLIEYISWRGIFFVTAPIGLLCSGLALFVLPREGTARPDRGLDLVGSAAWVLFLAPLVLATTIDSALAIIPLVGFSIIALFLFIRHENGAVDPILPLGLLKKRFFSAALLSALLSFTVLFSVIILIPFYLDRVQGLPALRIGLVMMAIPVSVLVVAPLAGWLSDYVSARFLTTLGLTTSTAGLLLLTGLSAQTHPLSVALHLSLLGCGQALFLSPNSASVLANVDSSKTGVSAGLLATARNLGMLLGVAQAGLIFSLYFGLNTGGLDLKDFGPQHVQSFMTALKASFLTTTAIGVASMLASWLRGPLKARRRY
ncbi:MAG: MFS transporter [Desulfobacterales bacterium]|nr:MFS transporter [Desulfobacterales bacterium]